MNKNSKDAGPVKSSRRPATSIEARENQLIAQAVDLASQQLAAGTASSQVITHFLKLGTTREQLEKARLEHETELLKAKVDDIASSARNEELLTKAIDVFTEYKGESNIEDDPYHEI